MRAIDDTKRLLRTADAAVWLGCSTAYLTTLPGNGYGEKDGLPIAPVIRRSRRRYVDGRFTESALVVCPFCALTHSHAWETGSRTAHCRPSNVSERGTYWIECPDGFPPTVVKRRSYK